MKDETFTFRLSKKDLEKIEERAKAYGELNLSQWFRLAALKYRPSKKKP